jgi:GTP-sensing pleiotropic transcriptional regulator CodY
MHPEERRSAWEDRMEAILPIAGALTALGIMLMILVA